MIAPASGQVDHPAGVVLSSTRRKPGEAARPDRMAIAPTSFGPPAMDSSEIIGLFGKRSDDPAVADFLARNRLGPAPKAPSDDFREYIEAKDRGLSLILEDAAHFLGQKTKALGTSGLLLVGAFFYAEGHEGFSQYREPLPKGVEFTSGRDAMIAKFGDSDFKFPKVGPVIEERWDLPEYRLRVRYLKDHSRIVLVYCGLPPKAG